MQKIIHILFIVVLVALIGFGIYRFRESKQPQVSQLEGTEAFTAPEEGSAEEVIESTVPRELEDYEKPETKEADLARISTEDYTTVFFSTFPAAHYKDEYFKDYRAIQPFLKASYCIPDADTLQEYLEAVSEKGNKVETAYLGIRPDVINAIDLIDLMSTWQSWNYEIILSYPSLDYWTSLSDEEYAETLAAYRDFVNYLVPAYMENDWLLEHLHVYFYGSLEWLVANSNNYESDFDVTEEITFMITMSSNLDHDYWLTLDNYEKTMDDFAALLDRARAEKAASTPKYPDLSDWDVVFFGDSVMVLRESSCIPSAFQSMTHAHVYNCGQGGMGASGNLSDVIDSFLAPVPSDLFGDNPINYPEALDNSRKKCFVIEFGFNDFFTGAPVDNSKDPLDGSTYAGAIRIAIKKLQEAYPDATFLLMAPNFSAAFGNGTQKQSKVGGTLPDYIAAMESISKEKGLWFYNSYEKLGIDSDNFKEYLLDEVHPNEATSYRIAADLTEFFK